MNKSEIRNLLKSKNIVEPEKGSKSQKFSFEVVYKHKKILGADIGAVKARNDVRHKIQNNLKKEETYEKELVWLYQIGFFNDAKNKTVLQKRFPDFYELITETEKSK